MYNSGGLIPARFLILVAHFALLIDAVWTSTSNCSQEEQITGLYCKKGVARCPTGVMAALGTAIGLICFEFFAFIIGMTMFNGSSALLSIIGHTMSCVLTAYFMFDQWQCGWFWCIFGVGSVLPAFYDLCAVVGVLVKKKY